MELSLGILVGAIIGLILLSAFFSGAETAFTGSSRIKLRSILDKNKQKSSHLEFLLNHPKQLLTCILIGNNLANIAATTFATAFFIYVVVNMMMVLGLLPIVGSPLPIMSYGGSSMLATMIGFGIVLSAKINHKQIIA